MKEYNKPDKWQILDDNFDYYLNCYSWCYTKEYRYSKDNLSFRYKLFINLENSKEVFYYPDGLELRDKLVKLNLVISPKNIKRDKLENISKETGLSIKDIDYDIINKYRSYNIVLLEKNIKPWDLIMEDLDDIGPIPLLDKIDLDEVTNPRDINDCILNIQENFTSFIKEITYDGKNNKETKENREKS